MVRFTVLASGSRGNCTVLSGGRTRILIDAGLSCRELFRRMNLAGEDPETLAAIDSLWHHSTGSPAPLARFFLNEHIELLYQGVLRQSQAFGICALIAMSLSCVGLFAVTASTAARRTSFSVRRR